MRSVNKVHAVYDGAVFWYVKPIAKNEYWISYTVGQRCVLTCNAVTTCA